MRFIFHPEAEDEFDEAIDYYEQCETGLDCQTESLRIMPLRWQSGRRSSLYLDPG
jgi:hypothetical protein